MHRLAHRSRQRLDERVQFDQAIGAGTFGGAAGQRVVSRTGIEPSHRRIARERCTGIRGNTKEVVLDVDGPSPILTSAGPNGGVSVLTGASATTKISRKEFGVLWNNLIESLPVVGDEVTITIDLELRRNAVVGQ